MTNSQSRCANYNARMESPEIFASVQAILATAPQDVVCAYLFGSQARGTARDESDVDVAILLRTPPARTLEGRVPPLGSELERALGRRVDLVLLNDAPPGPHASSPA